MSASQSWSVLAGTLLAGVLLYLLAPILTPFFIAAALAYLGDPLVDWFEARRWPRTAGVLLVFAVLFVLLLAGVLLLVPVLEDQISTAIAKWPAYVDWVQFTLLPWLTRTLGIDTRLLNLAQFKQTLLAHWQDAGGFAALLFSSASSSGLALLGWVANVVLIPVVTFYLLRDWDVLVAQIRELLPRKIEATAVRLAAEADGVLGAFLRGQLLVMTTLASVYTLGLWIVGLDVAFLIGLIAGLVSFVPYLGFITGILLAGVAAYLQFQEWTPLLWVALVFGVGQILEGTVLTPLLVGDKIGLHPVAVMFAVMAGGQLFGFIGVLLALPVAALIMVLLREVHRRYLNSTLYTPSG
ncbi:MAG: AI-2E family transporter [Gammaproteobacteria bacterium]|nr:AI-2E family transporter [Gammaproteobacteria bacterium]